MSETKTKQKRKDILESFSDSFPILEQAYEGYELLGSISKNHENTLRKSVEITCLEVLELIVLASRQQKDDKRQTLYAASTKLDTLKVFVDLAHKIKVLTQEQYDQIIDQFQSLGKMIGGWAKALRV